MKLTEKQRSARNQAPHAPAVAAMYLWPNDYMSQNGGSMDFWDGLSPTRQRIAREAVRSILAVKAESK